MTKASHKHLSEHVIPEQTPGVVPHFPSPGYCQVGGAYSLERAEGLPKER